MSYFKVEFVRPLAVARVVGLCVPVKTHNDGETNEEDQQQHQTYDQIQHQRKTNNGKISLW